jgi:tRNA threonylcarbamoyl adenosine modification protein (Sua5/YciO/YrdC/YwlC family)
MLLSVNAEYPEPRKLRRAAAALEAGEVIGYPTDTVYGLGCDLFNKHAIDRLYQIKQMSRTQQLAFICPDLSSIARYAIVEKATFRLLKHYLPGPYTFVLEATREVPKIVQTKRKTIGVRIPNHQVILALVRAFGRPVISTTAAPHGEEPYVDPDEIDSRFKGLALVLDAGPGGRKPTTVIDLTTPYPTVIREGAGPIDDFLDARPSLPPPMR